MIINFVFVLQMIINFVLQMIIHFVFVLQMRKKVGRLTQTLYEEGRGDANTTAQVFANFCSQLAVKPFLSPAMKTPQHVFGENALSTLAKAKEFSTKPGCAADMFRRNVLVSGAEGPLSTNKVDELCMVSGG